MFVPWETLARGHPSTEICRRRAEQKRRCLATSAARVATGIKLRYCGHILDKVDTFKYISIMVPFDDNDWSAVLQNLQKLWIK